MKTEILNANVKEFCKYLLECKISFIPICFNDKKPLVKWENFQKTLPEEKQIEEWINLFKNFNLAIITGFGNKDLGFIIGFDIDIANEEEYEKNQEKIEEQKERLKSYLISKLSNPVYGFYDSSNNKWNIVIYDTRKGLRIVLKIDKPIVSRIWKNVKIKLNENEEIEVNEIYLKGRFGYILIPPSIVKNYKFGSKFFIGDFKNLVPFNSKLTIDTIFKFLGIEISEKDLNSLISGKNEKEIKKEQFVEKLVEKEIINIQTEKQNIEQIDEAKEILNQKNEEAEKLLKGEIIEQIELKFPNKLKPKQKLFNIFWSSLFLIEGYRQNFVLYHSAMLRRNNIHPFVAFEIIEKAIKGNLIPFDYLKPDKGEEDQRIAALVYTYKKESEQITSTKWFIQNVFIQIVKDKRFIERIEKLKNDLKNQNFLNMFENKKLAIKLINLFKNFIEIVEFYKNGLANEEDVEETIKKIYKKYLGLQYYGEKTEILTLDKIKSEKIEMENKIFKVIPNSTLIMFAGYPESFKTIFVIYSLVSAYAYRFNKNITIFSDFEMQENVEPKILFIELDERKETLIPKIKSIINGIESFLDENQKQKFEEWLNNNFHIFSSLSTDILKWLEKYTDKYDIIVVDPFSSLFKKSEWEIEEVKKVFYILESIAKKGKIIILIGHFRKVLAGGESILLKIDEKELPRYFTSQMIRGSSYISQKLDIVYNPFVEEPLKKDENNENELYAIIRITYSKQRLPLPNRKWFFKIRKIDENGIDKTIVEQIEEYEKEPKSKIEKAYKYLEIVLAEMYYENPIGFEFTYEELKQKAFELQSVYMDYSDLEEPDIRKAFYDKIKGKIVINKIDEKGKPIKGKYVLTNFGNKVINKILEKLGKFKQSSI